MTIAAFKDLPTGFVQVNAPALQLGGAYSTPSYSFSLLISGPIAKNTAIDPELYVSVPGNSQGYDAFAAFFPVSVSGQLQTYLGVVQRRSGLRRGARFSSPAAVPA